MAFVASEGTTFLLCINYKRMPMAFVASEGTTFLLCIKRLCLLLASKNRSRFFECKMAIDSPKARGYYGNAAADEADGL
ncbi:MAG: hypothetical protein HYT72_04275 [Candidatus Aenigmarchaeota archaeon]|nr:hypothetical protein [Candidatus Aenigmarchaeota archaeon]